MKLRREPLFLARQSYRRRRLEDAAHILPVLGIFLFLLPLLATQTGTAGQGLYLFAAWFALIVAAGLISNGLRRLPDVARDPEDELTEGRPVEPSSATKTQAGRH